MDPRTFFPLTFTERKIRVWLMPKHGTEKTRYRRTARLIALNPDPSTLGEVLLQAIKSGVHVVPSDPITLELARLRAIKEGV